MPQIAQQDYIRIQIPTVESGGESDFTNEQVRQLYRCARNRTLGDVILVNEDANHYIEIRIIAWNLSSNGRLSIWFYSNPDGDIVTFAWAAEPDPDDE